MSDLGNKEVMARNLRYYVEKSGKTQKEMSEIIGVATSTFNDWMKGKAYPRIDKIEMLAGYFHIQKSDLIEDKIKNNDTITDAIVRMRSDTEFMSVVETLLTLDSDKLSAVKHLMLVLQK